MEKSIVIDIAAPVHSGKTMIASALVTMLTEAGFTNVTVPGREETVELFQQIGADLHKLKDSETGGKILDLPVVITQTNIHRASRDPDNYIPTNHQLVAVLRKARGELALAVGEINTSLIEEIDKLIG